MTDMPIVISAEYVEDHKIRVAFDDGAVGVVDFSGWLDGQVFEPLRDPTYFRKFFIDGGTVSWPNGADFAPEALYEQVKSSDESAA